MGGALNVILVGNPNTGKTTLFNLLTGARERTGNWTGVTVESAHAGFTLDGRAYRIADLPGIYLAGGYLRRLLVGISPFDPVTLSGVAVGLAAVALMACYLPGRRVLAIDPAQALRQQ